MDDRDECYMALYTAKTVPFMVPKTLLTELVGALPLFCNESIQWFDGSLLEARGRQRKELRRSTLLRPEHLDTMIATLDAYPYDSRIVPDAFPAFCANIVSGHENAEALGQELRELAAMSFLLTFWVKTPSYQVKALRAVVEYERHLLIQREQV